MNNSEVFVECFQQRRVRSSREVIVQRAEVERREARESREGREPRSPREGRRDPRTDEWADPWMRAEPAARRRKPPSSDDSYSSSRYDASHNLTIGLGAHNNSTSTACDTLGLSERPLLRSRGT